MDESQTSLDVLHLQHLLAKRDHKLFLAAFERMTTPPRDFLKALGGEGLCLLLEDADVPRSDWSRRYAALLLNRAVVAPPEVISRLATLLNSSELIDLARQVGRKKEALRRLTTVKRDD